ncbi:dienelactone hydrolase family protein [Acidianus brierleyi]|uniref:Carboxymethylenebutenolidase n=1 Tax=Acidianus brierleyi TaxID=41673 RepID=A0A2U9IHU1_9CREN|nr:dienelactone hydrolase family protein [Acidianus brierleyi]AWR95613.1 dienelactone hydrolase family protein [Acidianus brierleyi]
MSQITSSEVAIRGDREIKEYVASPENPKAGIIVIHEIWGLNDNIKDIVNRFAKEGYYVVAPHLYSQDFMNEENIKSTMTKFWSIPAEKRGDEIYIQKVYESSTDVQKKIIDVLVMNRENTMKQMIKDLVSVYSNLKNTLNKKIGAIGFCMGGGLAFELATEVELDAVTVFYGANPNPLEKISKIKGPILGIYAGEDRNIDSGLPDLLKAIIEYKKDLELKIYPGTQHAFFNDRGPVYNKDAAEDAWNRTIRFFSRWLS